MMRYYVNRKDAIAAATKLKRVASTRGYGVPVLGGIHVDPNTGTWTATDLEVAATYTPEGETTPGDAFVVPAPAFLEALKATPDGTYVELVLEGERVDVGGTSIRLLPAEDYPALAGGWNDSGTYRIPAGDLRDALERVLPATSADEARPVLCGVNVEVERTGDHGYSRITLAATDSFRLHVVELNAGDLAGEGFERIPGRSGLKLALSWLGKRPSGPVIMQAGTSHLRLAHGSWSLVMHSYEGEYPRYRQLVPDPVVGELDGGVWTPDGDALADALEGAVRFTGRDAVPARILLDPAGSSALLVVDRPDIGRYARNVNGTYDGPRTVFGVNAGYLRDAFKGAGPGSRIELRPNAGSGELLKPLVIRGMALDVGTVTTLVMPVRAPGGVGSAWSDPSSESEVA